MLLAVKSFEIFPKYKGYFFISESFVLNLHNFVTLENERLLLPWKWRFKQNFLYDLEKLIQYSATAVNVVSSKSRVGPLTRIKVSLFLLWTCTDELISTPKITIFLPPKKFGIGKRERESNRVPYPK